MRVSTGIKNLDNIIEGGFPKNTRILVSGGPGSGKTLFALKFLMEGVKRGERCCLVSLNETEEESLRACRKIDSLKDAKKYIGKNFAIENIQMGKSIPMKKFVEIISKYPEIDRLVIDNVNKLLIFSEDKKAYRLHMSDLIKRLGEMGCSLLICETTGDHLDTGNGESFECDGVVNISFNDMEEKPIRTLSVTKMRYTSFDPKILYELIINNKDVTLGSVKIV